MEKKYPIGDKDKLTILKKHYFDYYRPSFPSDERTTEVVNRALCIKEETEAIFKAMDECAAAQQVIGWVKEELPTNAGEYYCKCKVDGDEKMLIVEFDKNGQWGEVVGYDYYEDFEIIEWLDETGQSQQLGRETPDWVKWLSDRSPSVPDLSACTQEEKLMLVDALFQACGAQFMKMFYAIGLKTHMESGLVNDSTGDLFRLRFELMQEGNPNAEKEVNHG